MHLTTSCPCEILVIENLNYKSMTNIELGYDTQIISLVYFKWHPPYLVVLHFLLLLAEYPEVNQSYAKSSLLWM